MEQAQIIAQVKNEFGGNVKKFIEATFRVRDPAGNMMDYRLVPPHVLMLRSGLLGDRSALWRVTNKGRRGGFTTFECIETAMIAQTFPNSYQYYIATQEEQGKDWLRMLEQVAKDARKWPDGTDIIDIDSVKSSQLRKVFKHRMTKQQIDVMVNYMEESYVTGLAASPGGIRGKGAIKLGIDEFAWNIQKKNQQEELYAAVRKFVMSGGALSVWSTPRSKKDLFWKLMTEGEKFGFRTFYFPTIENWQQLDLNMPLYAELDTIDKFELDLIKSAGIFKFGKKMVKREIDGIVVDKQVDIAYQHCVIPYWWLDLKDIESDRAFDLAIFKQESLGIPAEEMVVFIPKDLVDINIEHDPRFINNWGGMIKIAVDVAQKHDYTFITVGEWCADGTIRERWIQESQEKYTDQAKLIGQLCERYKPYEIVIDNTGVGIALGDIIENEGLAPLNRIDFRSNVETRTNKQRITQFMAEDFKRALINQKYKMLNNRLAIDHVLNVEKIVTDANIVRYSGKRGGTERDDGFWSKAMLNYAFSEALMKLPAFGTSGDLEKQKQGFYTSVNERNMEGISYFG